MPGAASPQWTGGTLLRPGEKLEQTVRLDGPQLGGVLSGLPQQRLTVSADVTTNSATVQTEQGPAYVTGPVGKTVSAVRLIDRIGVPLATGDDPAAAALNAKVEQLRSGDPLERLRAAQLVLAQIRWVSGYAAQLQKDGAAADKVQNAQQIGGLLYDALRRAAGSFGVPQGDEAPATAWLKYAAAAVNADEAARAAAARQLLASDAFESRVVGLLGVATLVQEPAVVEALVGPVADGDPDPTVRRLAVNQLRYFRSRPATRPAARPAPEPVPGG